MKANPHATFGSVQWTRNEHAEEPIVLTHEDGKHFNYMFEIEDGVSFLMVFFIDVNHNFVYLKVSHCLSIDKIRSL